MLHPVLKCVTKLTSLWPRCGAQCCKTDLSPFSDHDVGLSVTKLTSRHSLTLMWGTMFSECCYKTDLSPFSDHDVGHNVLRMLLQNWPLVTFWPWYGAQCPHSVTKLTSLWPWRGAQCYKTDLSTPLTMIWGSSVCYKTNLSSPSDHDVGHNVLRVLQNWPPSDHDVGLSVTKTDLSPPLTMIWGSMSSECDWQMGFSQSASAYRHASLDKRAGCPSTIVM